MPRPAPVGGGRAGAPGLWHPLLLLALALGAWLYHPILQVNFFADDLAHFVAIESDGILDFVLAPFGGHNLLVSKLAMVAAWELFGLRAPLHYAVVLATHLLNVALLFGTLRRLTASSALACFGAALWGASPLCVGTIGWYSVYGQVLAVTCLLAVLYRLAGYVETAGVPPRREAALWYGLLLAGTTCFGVGIGSAAAFPVVLFLLLPAMWRQPRARIAWLLLPVVTVALYFGFRRLYALVGVMTSHEALQEYIAGSSLRNVPAILWHLLVYAVAGSILTFFLPGYPSATALVAAGAFVAGVGVLAATGDGATRRTALAMATLALAIYATIAVGRANMYAMLHVPPANAARMPRYHYAGSVPLVILLCLVIQHAGRLRWAERIPAPLALAAGLGAIVAGIVTVGVPIQTYPWTRAYVDRIAAGILADVRARPPGATIHLENDETPMPVLGPIISNTLFPGRAGVFVLLHPSDDVEGRTVRFIERHGDVSTFYAARPGSRLARLLVRPEAVAVQP